MENTHFRTERDLIKALQNNSESAFIQLFNRYSQKLYRFSQYYLRSDMMAEEIVQEVFLKIWENRHKLKSETSIQSYLFTIAFNSIKKHFNKKLKDEKYKTDIIDMVITDHNSLETEENFEKLVARLEFLIDQMPPKRKEIFIKRKKECKSVRIIAQEYNISTKTVENHITEAMRYLKKEFLDSSVREILFFIFLTGKKNQLFA